MKLMELYQDKIMGAIRGLDRIRFRGTLRWLANDTGMKTFLRHSHILLKDFGQWANNVTARVRESCQRRAAELGIELLYLPSSSVNKEKLARRLAEEKGISQGPICMFSVVEPCMAPMVRGDKAAKKLTLEMRPRKCVWIYHYFNDAKLGFGHVRLQTWLPLNVFICVNGRHWLEQGLRKEGIGYIKDGNCFPWIEDIASAQELMDKQLESDWPAMLNRMALEASPVLSDVIVPYKPEYYWSADETEWATDIMFNSTGDLDDLYSALVFHAMQTSDSSAVMRFLGRRGGGRLPNEVVSPACNKIKRKGKTYRGLNPWEKQDYRLLTFLAKGEHALSGFRNKDLRRWLYRESKRLSGQELKSCSGRTTRRIKLLRVHGLRKKVAKENRYTLTAKGRKFACALMSASSVDIKGLTTIAA
ncbi:MAG: hypothetical protein ISS79_10640 [Phycisphaerae bacterium]|nr:hypothetical protein [Phycisphaerae bacterium]